MAVAGVVTLEGSCEARLSQELQEAHRTRRRSQCSFLDTVFDTGWLWVATSRERPEKQTCGRKAQVSAQDWQTPRVAFLEA